jgi:hypothetical protein
MGRLNGIPNASLRHLVWRGTVPVWQATPPGRGESSSSTTTGTITTCRGTVLHPPIRIHPNDAGFDATRRLWENSRRISEQQGQMTARQNAAWWFGFSMTLLMLNHAMIMHMEQRYATMDHPPFTECRCPVVLM